VYARRFFYDTILFDPFALRHVIHTFGASQIVVGSDYPFAMSDADPVGTVQKAGLDEATIRAVLCENAARFLGRGAK
jgi:aminocarboxymuconate-semialdehyde decarboxylase